MSLLAAGLIVVLGDSLAAGHGARDPQNRPAAYLERELKQPVKDLSRSGSVTSQTLAASRSLPPKPSLIFVSTGGNDAIRDYYRQGSYPAKQTLKEMDELFDRLVNTGATVVYLGLNPPVPNVQRLQDASELARKKGILVVDGLNGLWGDRSAMADLIHPNDKGYGIICKRILDLLKKSNAER